MKRSITFSTFQALPQRIQQEIFAWQKRKGYPYNPCLTFTDCIEFLRDESRNERKDDGYHGWKAHVLEFQDFLCAFESDEPIDDAFFEVVQVIKNRLSQ